MIDQQQNTVNELIQMTRASVCIHVRRVIKWLTDAKSGGVSEVAPAVSLAAKLLTWLLTWADD